MPTDPPTDAPRNVYPLELTDPGGDRIRFTVDHGRESDWPVDVWIAPPIGAVDHDSPALIAEWSLEQLASLVTWAQGVLPEPAGGGHRAAPQLPPPVSKTAPDAQHDATRSTDA